MQSRNATICHGRDQFAPGARHALSASLLKQPNGTVLTCDDVVVRRSHNGETGYEHRQYRGPSSWRLFIRGSNGGLITTPAALIRPEQLQQNYESLEAFRIDLLLQITRHQPHSLLHISEVLVKTDARNNLASLVRVGQASAIRTPRHNSMKSTSLNSAIA